MAFPVPAPSQIAPTSFLNRTQSLTPLGPGFCHSCVHNLGSLRGMSGYFNFSFDVLCINNVFSTSEISSKKKALENVKVEISSPSETNQWCCVKRHPWANGSCPLLRGQAQALGLEWIFVITNTGTTRLFAWLVPDCLLYKYQMGISLRWYLFCKFFLAVTMLEKKIFFYYSVFLTNITSILNPALTMSSLKH